MYLDLIVNSYGCPPPASSPSPWADVAKALRKWERVWEILKNNKWKENNFLLEFLFRSKENIIITNLIFHAFTLFEHCPMPNSFGQEGEKRETRWKIVKCRKVIFYSDFWLDFFNVFKKYQKNFGDRIKRNNCGIVWKKKFLTKQVAR